MAAALSAPILGASLCADAEVRFEPSATLTRESVEVAPRVRAAYAYPLDAGSELVFTLRTERWRRDPLRVWLVDERNFRRIGTGEPFEFFQSASGLAQRVAHIAFTVPVTDRYYVILDNTQAVAPRVLDVYAYSNDAELSAEERERKATYDAYYAAIMELFELEDFDIVIARCGRSNAYYYRVIVICRELDDFLVRSAPPGVRLFILMHEVAHKFLDVWGYRSTFQRQVEADRFAATLIELTEQGHLAADAAAWFEKFELRSDVLPEDAPIGMSRSRAKRIADWLEGDDDIERLWTSRIVVPRLRTAALESLLAAGELPPRTLRWLERELDERRRADESH